MDFNKEDTACVSETQACPDVNDSCLDDRGIDKLEERVHALLADYQNLVHEAAALKEANARLEGENKQLKDKNAVVVSKISALIDRLSHIHSS